jgi:hypothetical protein
MQEKKEKKEQMKEDKVEDNTVKNPETSTIPLPTFNPVASPVPKEVKDKKEPKKEDKVVDNTEKPEVGEQHSPATICSTAGTADTNSNRVF